MRYGLSTRVPVILALALAVAWWATPCPAAVYDLKADTVVVTMPDSTPVTMWGFGLLADPAVTVPGPALSVPPGDTALTVNLTNNLTVPVSIVVPGQPAALSPVWIPDAQGRPRVQSFAAVTAPGATGSYSWTGLKPGTYLYQSGTHPAVQVQMGLYGALSVIPAAGEAYPGIPYDSEVLLLYSEVDPALHAAVVDGTYGTPAYPSPLGYLPQYFMVNGQPFSGSSVPVAAGNLNERVLIRFLNAGLKTHVPTLETSYLTLVAEDGNPYPYASTQYSVFLPAGKTADAVWMALSTGTHALFDRSLHLTTAGVTGGGMLTELSVSSLPGTPSAADDSFATDEETPLNVTAPGVLVNDTPGTTAVLVDDVVVGTLSLLSDGSFSYSPATDFAGTEVFTYRASTGVLESNLATVSITVNPVNDLPVAVNDSFTAYQGSTLAVAAPGLLGNDTDADMDALSVDLPQASGPSGGILALAADGSFEYTPDPGTVSDSFTYTANDGTGSSAEATVQITVSEPVNVPPVARDDSAVTAKAQPVTINLLANDSDEDGTLDPASVVITSDPRQGGTVQNMLNGTVIYTPRRRFLGTDVFKYTVADDGGAVSNEAKVRVNVVRAGLLRRIVWKIFGVPDALSVSPEQ